MPRSSLRALLLLLPLLSSIPPSHARPFLPGPANAYGYLVPAPSGGLGCGHLNYVGCFPEVTRTLRRWSAQLRAAYASPLARARADATGPKDARAAAESLGLDPGNHPNVPAVVVVRDVPPDAFPDVVDAFARDADAALAALRRAGEYAEDLRERFVRTLAPAAEQKAAKTTAALLAAQDAVKALAREAAAAAEKTRARRR